LLPWVITDAPYVSPVKGGKNVLGFPEFAQGFAEEETNDYDEHESLRKQAEP